MVSLQINSSRQRDVCVTSRHFDIAIIGSGIAGGALAAARPAQFAGEADDHLLGGAPVLQDHWWAEGGEAVHQVLGRGNLGQKSLLALVRRLRMWQEERRHPEEKAR